MTQDNDPRQWEVSSQRASATPAWLLRGPIDYGLHQLWLITIYICNGWVKKGWLSLNIRSVLNVDGSLSHLRFTSLLRTTLNSWPSCFYLHVKDYKCAQLCLVSLTSLQKETIFCFLPTPAGMVLIRCLSCRRRSYYTKHQDNDTGGRKVLK